MSNFRAHPFLLTETDPGNVIKTIPVKQYGLRTGQVVLVRRIK